MATNVSSVTNHFPSAQDGFTTTTSGSTASGATTVVLNSVSGYTNGQTVVLIIEPTSLTAKQAFTGVVDTAGVQITGVKWTSGTNQTHVAGVTVVDYETATHWSMVTKGLLNSLDQDGTLKAGAVDVTAVLADSVVTKDKLSTALELEHDTGWNLSYAGTTNIVPTTITNNGNRSYTNVYASSVASFTSEGMRKRFTRTVSAPTYMGGAFNGSSHYFTKVTPTSTLSTVTDNFTIMGWIEPTAYAVGTIAARSDAGANNYLGMRMEATGQISVQVGVTAGANFRTVLSYQSVPLNKKTHVAVTWASGTVLMYIDGVSVPVGAASTGGTAPTAAGTGGDFSIGRFGAFAGQYFTGYISGVGVFNAVLTAATIRSYSSQVLSGSETNCIGAWSLNNTGVNQQAAGTNDLTATGGVSYTVRSPYGSYLGGTLEYGIVTSISSDGLTETIQVPEGCALPTSGGVSAVAYSTQSVPYGFPKASKRWKLASIWKNDTVVTSNATYGAFSSGGWALTVPIGAWTVGWQAQWASQTSVELVFNISKTALTGMARTAGANESNYGVNIAGTPANYLEGTSFVSDEETLTTASTFVMYTLGATTNPQISGSRGITEIFAICAYL